MEISQNGPRNQNKKKKDLDNFIWVLFSPQTLIIETFNSLLL